MSYARFAKLRKDNKTGYKGVSYSKTRKRYVANIKVNGKKRQLGTYATPEAAYEAYLIAVKKYVPEAKEPQPEHLQEGEPQSSAS